MQRSLSPERRKRILDAALALALRQGPATVTMEAVARQAAVAKPTLYAYFAGKDAVFDAIAAFIVSDVRRAVDAAAAGEADAVARVGAMLAARHRTLARLFGKSPHAEALREVHNLRPPLDRLEGILDAAIIRELEAAGLARARPLGRLLIAAAEGVGGRANEIAEIGPAIRLLAERLIRPELEGGRPRA